MTDREVRVVAPSRLHFGMLSVNQPAERRYGGIGAMVSSPGLEIVVRSASRLEVVGPMAERAREAAQKVREVLCHAFVQAGDHRRAPRGETVTLDRGDCLSAHADEMECRIEVVRSPRHHTGLGAGTQLAMAVASGLNAYWGGPPMDAGELARCVGRGQRSAIGLYGFVHGGLIFEAGKADGEEIAPLVRRVELPSAWRFVLVCPHNAEGLSGDAERAAFAQLPPVPVRRAESLRREALEHLLPAAADGRFEEFSESLYRFGYEAGLSFAAQQGGPFAGPRLTELVAWLRREGVAGVGQSSWGPTLFALVPDDSSAACLVARLRERSDGEDLDINIAWPDNRGARIRVVET